MKTARQGVAGAGRDRDNAQPSRSPSHGRLRGRPRVEKRDTTAQERRRTQIRLAQRAYRQRQESTLEDLRQKMVEVSATLERMNQAFLDLKDQLATADLGDTQLHALNVTAHRYHELMKTVYDDDGAASLLPEVTVGSSASSPHGDAGHHLQEGPTSSDDVQNVSRSRRLVIGQNVSQWMDTDELRRRPTLSDPSYRGMGYILVDMDEERTIPLSQTVPGDTAQSARDRNTAWLQSGHSKPSATFCLCERLSKRNLDTICSM